MTMHGASAESAPWLSVVNEGPAWAIKNRMGCEVEGTMERRDKGTALSSAANKHADGH